MVKLRRSRNIAVKVITGMNQDRVAVNAGTLQQRSQQYVFVLAITVFVMQHLDGRMRLVSPHSKGQAHIPDVLADKVINATLFLLITGGSLGEHLGLCLHVRTRDETVRQQTVIPLGDLPPATERRQLNIRRGGLLLRRIRAVLFHCGRLSKVGTLPCIDFGVRGFLSGIRLTTLDVKLTASGGFYDQTLILNLVSAVEGVSKPELIRSQRFDQLAGYLVFQRI